MGNASQLFKDDEEEQATGTPSDDQLRHMTGIGRDEEGAMDREAGKGAQEDIANRENNFSKSDGATESSGGKSVSPEGLSAAEDAAALGAGFTGVEDATAKSSKLKRTLWGSKTRQRTTVAGTLVGLLVGGGFGGLFFAAGPLEFIHIAQELTSHGSFADQNNAGDDRTGKLYRFLRSGNDPGETRLGFLGSKMKSSMLADLDRVGIKPVYGHAGIPTALEIDTTNEDSPFSGLDEDQVRAKLATQGVSDGISIETGKDGAITKATVSIKGFFGGKNAAKILVANMNESKVPNALRVRWLSKYFGFSWHPLKYLGYKANSAALNAWENKTTASEEGQPEATSIDTASATEETTGPNGQPVDTPVVGGTSSTPSSSTISDTLKGFSTGTAGKVGGGLAAVQGLICSIKAVNDHIGAIRYANDIVPLMNMSWETITVASQIESGKDIDTREMGVLAKQFYNVNAKEGEQSWDSARTIQADDGAAVTGPDINGGIRGTLGESSPSWLSGIANAPGVGTTCSAAGQVIGGGVGFAVGIFSGEAVNTLVSTVAGALVVPQFVGYLSHLLAGNAVNVAAQGAEWGNDIKYGTQFNGNTMAVQDGGIQMTTAESAQSASNTDAVNQQEFQSQSIAYRLFNPADSRSLIAHVVDSQSPNVSQNVASMFSDFTNLGSSLIKIPATLFSGIAHAVPQPYQYPFPEFGFSQADLANADPDPYDNAKQAAVTLDTPCTNPDGSPNHPCGQDYINQARTCFDVNIEKTVTPGDDGVARWDVIPGASGDRNNLNLYDSTTYDAINCRTPTSPYALPNWLQIRIFMLDTSQMEGYACQHGDDASCQNDGAGGSADSTATTSAAGSIINMAALDTNSTTVACATGTTDLGTTTGYYNGGEVPIRLCGIPNLPSTGAESTGGYGAPNANGVASVNSVVSGAVYAMVQAANQAGVKLTASSSFRTMTHQECLANHSCGSATAAQPGYSNHQMGLAIDFNMPQCSQTINGQCSDPGNSFWDWLSKNAGAFGYKSAVTTEAWHWSPTGN